jgi:hypothetical protein
VLRFPVAAKALIFFKMNPGHFYHDPCSEIYTIDGVRYESKSIVPRAGEEYDARDTGPNRKFQINMFILEE